MIINKDEKIHIIQFKHKGMNLKFQMPAREEYLNSIRETERNEIIDDIAEIAFEDSREIEILIGCLNVFLREAIKRTNEWRRLCD